MDIDTFLKNKPMSVCEMCRQSHVSRSTIYKLLKTGRISSYEVAKKIEETTNNKVTVEEMLLGKYKNNGCKL